jgi:cytochrome c
MRCASIPALVVVVATACGAPPQPAAAPSGDVAEAAVNKEGPRYGLGRSADAARVAAVDIDIGADGSGLPPGRGSVTDGEKLYRPSAATVTAPQGRGWPPSTRR